MTKLRLVEIKGLDESHPVSNGLSQDTNSDLYDLGLYGYTELLQRLER